MAQKKKQTLKIIVGRIKAIGFSFLVCRLKCEKASVVTKT